jgi:hypothetical protein
MRRVRSMAVDLDALEAEAVRLARGPGIADAVPTEREADLSLARQRLLALQKESGLSVNAFADLLDCDEKALRCAKKNADGISVPWWLERLLRERPEFVAAFAARLVHDAKVAIAAKRAANG